ncbi:hypothetical protein [Paenibacillus eucommiae]|uniref:Uncharacterized protein n=1 Tax=Paenibacillus eucommiae TaxID=1355755 RepID=A0ABS4J020_9BACL|nr:hypothetical protein [Paenibacillus eucommiae]MBP1993156.1 hypothetical protein [Paenibacillus eucommiae]
MNKRAPTQRAFQLVSFIILRGKGFQEERLGSLLLFRLGVFDETWEPIENPEYYYRIVIPIVNGQGGNHVP